MALSTVTGGTQRRIWGTRETEEDLAASTSTATRTVSVAVDTSGFTGPTATISNFFTMADGHEGQRKFLFYEATGAGGTTASSGDIHIVPTTIANLSSITFREVGEFWIGEFIDGSWRTIERQTTEIGTSTASGAIPVTVDMFRLLRATGTDMAYTLAAGRNGQEMLLTALTGTAVRTVTPAVMHKYTLVQMGNTTTTGATNSRYALLKYMMGAWHIISPINLNTTGTLMDENGVIVS